MTHPNLIERLTHRIYGILAGRVLRDELRGYIREASEDCAEAVADEVSTLTAEVEAGNAILRNVCRWGELVMIMLEEHGGKVVPHLIDTDDNPGQFLREAIAEARATLTKGEGGKLP